MVLTVRRLAVLVLVAAAPRLAAAQPARVDLLSLTQATPEQWERFTRRSESPPITLKEVRDMQAAGIGDATLLEMIRTRRINDRVAPANLVALKKAGASDDLIAAVSAYALAENRSVDLLLTLDVRTIRSVAQAPYLYLEAWHGKLKRREYLLFADLRALLSGSDVLTDRSDLMLPDRVRRVRRHVALPLRHPGPIELRLLVSRHPDLQTLDGLPAAEARRVKRWSFELPAVSLYHDCELELGLTRDELIPDLYSVERSRLQCTFN